MRLHTHPRTAVALTSAIALVAAPLLVPTPASATTTATTTAATTSVAAMQSITIKVAKRTINVRGARNLDAGRVKVRVKGAGAAEIVMFDRGYDMKDLGKDIAAVDKGNMKALRRALANTTFLGGFEAGGSGTVVLPKAGRYSVFSFASRGVAEFRAAASKKAPKPKVDGKIIAKAGPKWAGSSMLPAQGTFKFKNADRTVPHFVILQQVAEGTTTDEVLQFLQTEEGPPPFLKGSLETASISSRRSMTVDYDLPPGQYVIMCFFPDPNMKGMPHALMGMLKMVHLM